MDKLPKYSLYKSVQCIATSILFLSLLGCKNIDTKSQRLQIDNKGNFEVTFSKPRWLTFPGGSTKKIGFNTVRAKADLVAFSCKLRVRNISDKTHLFFPYYEYSQVLEEMLESEEMTGSQIFAPQFQLVTTDSATLVAVNTYYGKEREQELLQPIWFEKGISNIVYMQTNWVNLDSLLKYQGLFLFDPMSGLNWEIPDIPTHEKLFKDNPCFHFLEAEIVQEKWFGIGADENLKVIGEKFDSVQLIDNSIMPVLTLAISNKTSKDLNFCGPIILKDYEDNLIQNLGLFEPDKIPKAYSKCTSIKAGDRIEFELTWLELESYQELVTLQPFYVFVVPHSWKFKLGILPEPDSLFHH
ncbi:MAG: hypothetical protein R2824_29625 [Saprospiraceae bacterium]